MKNKTKYYREKGKRIQYVIWRIKNNRPSASINDVHPKHKWITSIADIEDLLYSGDFVKISYKEARKICPNSFKK